MNKLILHLFHGRSHPAENLDDWGEDGPRLEIDWFHVTYDWTRIIGHDNGTLTFMDVHEYGVRDGMIVVDCFHYDGSYYGDWTIKTWDGKGEVERFDPAKAIVSKDVNPLEECQR